MEQGQIAVRGGRKTGACADTESDSIDSVDKVLKEKLLNVRVRFEGEGGVKKVDLLKLTKIILPLY